MTLSLEAHRSKRQLLMRSSRWITLQVADELFPDCRRSGVFAGPEEPVRLLRFWPDQYFKLQQYFFKKN